MLTITIKQMHILADSVDTNRFINFWLRSMATRRERHFLKAYANHIILTPPQHAAHLVMIKISIHLCWSRSENSTAYLNGRKFKCMTSFQNPQILRTISSGHDAIHTPAPFPVWGFIM